MKKFSDLGVSPDVKNYMGDKIKIERILNKEIVVHEYKIVDSKFDGKGLCLHMQISIDNAKRVVFTGSKFLMDTIKKIAAHQFPFTTTIVKESDCFIFT